jgi:pyruvate/2-oxoglutarate dehydrogenase complex dihydrolipoamide acyltransferase (E2) component
LRPSPFQVFGHIVAKTAIEHPKLRSIMLSDDKIREYDHVNIGLALSRSDDNLAIAVVRAADRLDLNDYVRACNAQMRRTIKEGTQSPDDVQIILSHLGEFGIQSATPTLVAPANSVIFLGTPDPTTGLAQMSLTFDHRLHNGAGAARFLHDVAALVVSTADDSLR